MFSRGRRGIDRGQVTVFVMLAIVIMLAFMFLLFMKIIIEKERYAVMATKQVQDYISQNSLSIYVTSCIDSVTTEAIIRASLQGGIINFTNKTAGKDYVPYYVPEYNRTVNVSIAIVPNDNCPVVRNSPWEAPYPEVKLYPPDLLKDIYNNDPLSCKYSGDIYDYYSGFFGRNQLTKLCNWNGSNKIGATNTSFGVRTCELGTYTNSRVKSVQEDMEQFIEHEVQKCINFNEVLKNTPSNITQVGAPKALVIFGDNGFAVKLQYPFIVTVRGRQPIKAFYDFGIEKNVRLKELYDYAYFSARTDVQEAGFKMLDDKVANSDMAKVYRNYAIERIKSIDENQTDIIRMIDNGALVDGKPMILQFAIKNRRPALEYINEYSGLLDVDLVLQENESIIITPQGYDPDEDELVYDYGLWKEDYDEVYNMSNSNCLTNIPSIQYMKDYCMIRLYNSQPKSFTNSTEFKATGKNARYFPNSSDRGYHELNVSIKEVGRQGLMDWQVVRIFVFDKPTANITGNNLYPEISERYASIEDPYVLNGSNSLVGLSGAIPGFNNDFSIFIWNDSLGEFYIEVPITADRNKTLYLPVDINGSTTDNITIIKSYVFNKTGLRNISLFVNTFLGLSDQTSYEVDVKQCLPHRNLTDSAYPYNNSNPYFANHTCCDETFTIKGTGNPCYNSITYASNYTFNLLINDFWTRQPSPPPLPKRIFYSGYPLPPQRADNDIWMRTFTRYCSGDRGNTCTGDAQEYRQVVQTCDDTNYNSPSQFLDERCQGPPPGTVNIVSPIPIGCYNYAPRKTFESLFGQGGDGICTTSPQCANPASNNPFGSSSQRYKCDGLCGGDGRCSNVDLSSCICDSSCVGGGNSACDGISYFPSFGSGSPSGVIYCTGGNPTTDSPLYEDRCSNCGLVDAQPRVCRTPGPGSLIPDPSRIGCAAPDIQCDGKNANTVIGSNNNEGCTLECNYRDCGLYSYNPTINNCMTSCSVDEECAIGAICCNEQRIADNQCTLLEQGQCFIYVPD